MWKKTLISLSIFSMTISLTGCGTNLSVNQMSSSYGNYANESVRSFDIGDLDDRLTYNPGQTSRPNRIGDMIVLRSRFVNQVHYSTKGTQNSLTIQNQFLSNDKLTPEEAAQMIQNIALGNIRWP